MSSRSGEAHICGRNPPPARERREDKFYPASSAQPDHPPWKSSFRVSIVVPSARLLPGNRRESIWPTHTLVWNTQKRHRPTLLPENRHPLPMSVRRSRRAQSERRVRCVRGRPLWFFFSFLFIIRIIRPRGGGRRDSSGQIAPAAATLRNVGYVVEIRSASLGIDDDGKAPRCKSLI